MSDFSQVQGVNHFKFKQIMCMFSWPEGRATVGSKASWYACFAKRGRTRARTCVTWSVSTVAWDRHVMCEDRTLLSAGDIRNVTSRTGEVYLSGRSPRTSTRFPSHSQHLWREVRENDTHSLCLFKVTVQWSDRKFVCLTSDPWQDGLCLLLTAALRSDCQSEVSIFITMWAQCINDWLLDYIDWLVHW